MEVEKRLSLLTSLGRSGASPHQSYDALDVHLNKPADEPELAEVLSAPFWARVFQRPFFGLDLRQTGSVLKLEDLISQ